MRVERSLKLARGCSCKRTREGLPSCWTAEAAFVAVAAGGSACVVAVYSAANADKCRQVLRDRILLVASV